MKSLVLLPLAAMAHAAELRPLSTDRPDTTESPRTVDAGHFQLEMEIASVTRDGGDRSLTLGELNAKIGVDARNDLQLVLPFYERVHGGGEGFGNLQVRLKHNIWGNDHGKTALAVMPFVEVPSGNGDLGDGGFAGGIIVPFGFDGPAGWTFGVQGEVDLAENDGGNHQMFILTSATGSHSITETTGIFLELVSILSAEGRDEWEAYFNSGITWAVRDYWQLDVGIRTGLTDASADFTPFFGVSTKF